MIAWFKGEFSKARERSKYTNSISFNTLCDMLVKDLEKFYQSGAILEVVVLTKIKIITINVNNTKKMAIYYNNVFEKLDVELVMYKNNAVSYSKRYPIHCTDDFTAVINNVIGQINVITA